MLMNELTHLRENGPSLISNQFKCSLVPITVAFKLRLEASRGQKEVRSSLAGFNLFFRSCQDARLQKSVFIWLQLALPVKDG